MHQTIYNSLYIFTYVSNRIQLSLYLFICIKPDKTLSISLHMYQTGYNSLYIFTYVSNRIQLSLYLFICIKPDTTLSISLHMYQTGYNSLYIFKIQIQLPQRLYSLPRVIQLTAMKQISYSTDLIRYN